ncbi:hypothetical protein EVAR_88863_1 [Eumeta japonica]|uniref:Uncharacterized protein n=1 Tax=Eumeta variegata TaxID=151549 RepID=A0A4C1Y465_EUMVA|nr:hypothetical protein EVAR_88863_1 [Eumeta japonica]
MISRKGRPSGARIAFYYSAVHATTYQNYFIEPCTGRGTGGYNRCTPGRTRDLLQTYVIAAALATVKPVAKYLYTFISVGNGRRGEKKKDIKAQRVRADDITRAFYVKTGRGRCWSAPLVYHTATAARRTRARGAAPPAVSERALAFRCKVYGTQIRVTPRAADDGRGREDSTSAVGVRGPGPSAPARPFEIKSNFRYIASRSLAADGAKVRVPCRVGSRRFLGWDGAGRAAKKKIIPRTGRNVEANIRYPRRTAYIRARRPAPIRARRRRPSQIYRRGSVALIYRPGTRAPIAGSPATEGYLHASGRAEPFGPVRAGVTEPVINNMERIITPESRGELFGIPLR